MANFEAEPQNAIRRTSKSWKIAGVFTVFGVLGNPGWGLPPARHQALQADLDGDGRAERVVFNPEGDPALSVWHGGRALWRGVPKKWHPWKVSLLDVDGDGRLEIAVGVFKGTRFFPDPHPCLFIYGWDGKQLFPRWLGSSMGLPFEDFMAGDADGDGRDEVVLLEPLRDGKFGIAVGRWSGFGFRVGGRRGGWTTCELLAAKDGRIVVRTERGDESFEGGSDEDVEEGD